MKHYWFYFWLECGDLLTQKKLIHTTETNKDSSNKLNLITSTSKRGTGGRSSFSGQVVTVFGSTGRIARNIINRLGKEGFNVVCPYRGDDYDVRTLKLAGDLGQIQLLVCIISHNKLQIYNFN